MLLKGWTEEMSQVSQEVVLFVLFPQLMCPLSIYAIPKSAAGMEG